MCCQLQTLRESESRGRVKLPAVYIIPCITNIFPVLRQARIALDKPEPIQWYMLSKYIGSMRTARRKKKYCSQVELEYPAGLPVYPAPTSSKSSLPQQTQHLSSWWVTLLIWTSYTCCQDEWSGRWKAVISLNHNKVAACLRPFLLHQQLKSHWLLLPCDSFGVLMSGTDCFEGSPMHAGAVRRNVTISLWQSNRRIMSHCRFLMMVGARSDCVGLCSLLDVFPGSQKLLSSLPACYQGTCPAALHREHLAVLTVS